MDFDPEFGLYIHIPFCLQRCRYCDFATYATDEIPVNDDYLKALVRELETRRSLYPQTLLKTIYFGGGTPSLLHERQFESILSCVRGLGLTWAPDIEVTVEVNPATLNPEKCKAWRNLGINRVSIGAQTFSDELLSICGRKHTAAETLATLELVQAHFPNYSLDLLYALPGQTVEGLRADLSEIRQISPPHVSAYCLTLQEGHPMNQGRPPEGTQVEMFELVEESLGEMGLRPYELSNFARPGLESRHNLLYWQDKNYWGVGLSSHSFRHDDRGRYRFWNQSSYNSYMKEMGELRVSNLVEDSFPARNFEKLKAWEALTDYCHTQMRLSQGLDLAALAQKFPKTGDLVEKRLEGLNDRQLVEPNPGGYRLTRQGRVLSNLVFSELLFSAEDIDIPR